MRIRKPQATSCVCGDHFFARATRWAVVLVSPRDSHLLSAAAWCLIVPKPGYAYARSAILAKIVGAPGFLHKAIFPDAPMVDHRDGNGLDCRRSNIRAATRGLNRVNVRTAMRTKSGFIGVYANSGCGKPWKAAIKFSEKTTHLGYFNDPVEAAKVRDAAALKHFGEFATLNFPQVSQ